GDTQLSGYVTNDPINLRDPSGTLPEWLEKLLDKCFGSPKPPAPDPEKYKKLNEALKKLEEEFGKVTTNGKKSPPPKGRPGGGGRASEITTFNWDVLRAIACQMGAGPELKCPVPGVNAPPI